MSTRRLRPPFYPGGGVCICVLCVQQYGLSMCEYMSVYVYDTKNVRIYISKHLYH